MRRLGRSRDLTIFRDGLAAGDAKGQRPLPGLTAYWDDQQRAADEALQHYLGKPKREVFLERYRQFCATAGMGTALAGTTDFPPRIAHVAPVLVYERLALVRAMGAQLENLSVPQLHELRIQFKELRYTLDFLTPILGPQTTDLLTSLNRLQDHLGAINDARIALLLLDEVPDLATEVAHYRAFQIQELERLVTTFPETWAEIDDPDWRRELAGALAVL